ncbi:transposase family protein [Streptomyces sp. NPDC020362]|uniref:transposase family protein n=1 Tax=unclassified Streptomyces TaxID=2593676 RepID=UPI0033E6A913
MIRRGEVSVPARLRACVVAIEEPLPQLSGLRIARVDTRPEAVRITALTRNDVPRTCPGCGQGSEGTHSRYVRRVADEAVGGRPLVIELSVRRCPHMSPPTLGISHTSRTRPRGNARFVRLGGRAINLRPRKNC